MFDTVINRLCDILISGGAAALITVSIFTRGDVIQTVVSAETRDIETEFAVRCAPNLAGRIRCRLADDQAPIKTIAPSVSDLAAQVVDAATRNPAPERKPHA